MTYVPATRPLTRSRVRRRVRFVTMRDLSNILPGTCKFLPGNTYDTDPAVSANYFYLLDYSYYCRVRIQSLSLTPDTECLTCPIRASYCFCTYIRIYHTSTICANLICIHIIRAKLEVSPRERELAIPSRQILVRAMG